MLEKRKKVKKVFRLAAAILKEATTTKKSNGCKELIKSLFTKVQPLAKKQT